ncbi:MAG: hypothetical protein QOF76_1606 [Solirubrobacteraceae bacterium]|jgi:hypothetical protein|nr:hypothetical protein [Solirubrobacteraceae bacterium]
MTRPVLLTCAAVLALAGCGGDKAPRGPGRVLDPSRVERAITESIKAKRDLDATVVCPAGIPQRKGYAFACLAVLDGGGKNTFTVTETDDAGHVTYVGR